MTYMKGPLYSFSGSRSSHDIGRIQQGRSMYLDLERQPGDMSPPSDNVIFDNQCYATTPSSSNGNSDLDQPSTLKSGRGEQRPSTKFFQIAPFHSSLFHKVLQSPSPNNFPRIHSPFFRLKTPFNCINPLLKFIYSFLVCIRLKHLHHIQQQQQRIYYYYKNR